MSSDIQRSILPIPDRVQPGLTTYDAKDPDTKFPPIKQVRPPAGAPNVLVVLLDDVGFGASSVLGGPGEMPVAERLAAGGLRYNRFHTTALAGVAPERLTKALLDTGREQLIAATRRLHPDHPLRARPVTTRLHGAEATLFHAGVINVPPRKRHPDKSEARAQQWAAVPPRLGTTLQGYIEQTRLSLRPATMVRVEAVMREFAVWLTTHAPEIVCGQRSSTRSHRALQAPPRSATFRPRRWQAVEHRSRGAARHATRVPRSTQRMGRRGRPGAGADVRWRHFTPRSAAPQVHR